jgi:opacity protein-like surface antigen
VKHTTAFVFGLILPVAVMTMVIDDARAEGFVGFRVGGAFTPDTDGSATIGGEASPSGSIEFKPGVSVGIRGGYWLDSVPWLGFALDLSYFNPEEDVSLSPLELDVFPISALLMLRYPLLKSAAYPRGRLQPYAGVGPGAFVTKAKLKLREVGAPGDFSDTTVNAGVDVRGGAQFRFTGQDSPGGLAIFLEYRFTYFEPSDFKDDIGGVPIELELDELGTHHIAAGVSWYF